MLFQTASRAVNWSLEQTERPIRAPLLRCRPLTPIPVRHSSETALLLIPQQARRLTLPSGSAPLAARILMPASILLPLVEESVSLTPLTRSLPPALESCS